MSHVLCVATVQTRQTQIAMCFFITIDASSSSRVITCMINIQLFTMQILVLSSRFGHAYLSPRISLILNSGRVMNIF